MKLFKTYNWWWLLATTIFTLILIQPVLYVFLNFTLIPKGGDNKFAVTLTVFIITGIVSLIGAFFDLHRKEDY